MIFESKKKNQQLVQGLRFSIFKATIAIDKFFVQCFEKKGISK